MFGNNLKPLTPDNFPVGRQISLVSTDNYLFEDHGDVTIVQWGDRPGTLINVRVKRLKDNLEVWICSKNYRVLRSLNPFEMSSHAKRCWLVIMITLTLGTSLIAASAILNTGVLAAPLFLLGSIHGWYFKKL